MQGYDCNGIERLVIARESKKTLQRVLGHGLVLQ